MKGRERKREEKERNSMTTSSKVNAYMFYGLKEKSLMDIYHMKSQRQTYMDGSMATFKN